jgi:hypothetical protein
VGELKLKLPRQTVRLLVVAPELTHPNDARRQTCEPYESFPIFKRLDTLSKPTVGRTEEP